MKFLASALLVTLLAANAGCMLLVGGATYDAPVFVEGVLAETGQSVCSIRFVSARTGVARSTQNVAAGLFKTSFVMSLGDTLTDFHAELSCGGPWVTVGPDDAFSHGQHVSLGRVGV